MPRKRWGLRRNRKDFKFIFQVDCLHRDNLQKFIKKTQIQTKTEKSKL